MYLSLQTFRFPSGLLMEALWISISQCLSKKHCRGDDICSVQALLMHLANTTLGWKMLFTMCRVIMAWLSLCKYKLVSIKKTCIHKHKTKKIIQAKIKHDIITRHLLKFHILASKSAWAPVITLLWNLKCYITEC